MKTIYDPDKIVSIQFLSYFINVRHSIYEIPPDLAISTLRRLPGFALPLSPIMPTSKSEKWISFACGEMSEKLIKSIWLNCKKLVSFRDLSRTDKSKRNKVDFCEKRSSGKRSTAHQSPLSIIYNIKSPDFRGCKYQSSCSK